MRISNCFSVFLIHHSFQFLFYIHSVQVLPPLTLFLSWSLLNSFWLLSCSYVIFNYPVRVTCFQSSFDFQFNSFHSTIRICYHLYLVFIFLCIACQYCFPIYLCPCQLLPYFLPNLLVIVHCIFHYLHLFLLLISFLVILIYTFICISFLCSCTLFLFLFHFILISRSPIDTLHSRSCSHFISISISFLPTKAFYLCLRSRSRIYLVCKRV